MSSANLLPIMLMFDLHSPNNAPMAVNSLAEITRAPGGPTGSILMYSALLVLVLSFVLPVMVSARDASPSLTARLKQAPRILPKSASGVGCWVPDLRFTDLSGKTGKLSDYQSSKFFVIAFTNASCPVCKRYTPTLARLEKEYAAKGIPFLFVDPTPSDKLEELRSIQAREGLKGRYVHDVDGTFSAGMRVRTTAEVFLLDSSRTVRFRGAIDDQYGLGYSAAAPRETWLISAIEALLRDQDPIVTATEAPGCLIEIDTAKIPPTPLDYHTRISRIVRRHCGECHHPHGLAPFSLEDPQSLVSHKAMIKKVVTEGIMPPWNAAPPPKNEQSLWLNDRTLPAEDKADLIAWLNGDHAIGAPANAPTSTKDPDGWMIGKPDLVVEIPTAVNVPATGTMSYQYARVEPDFETDKWLQAVEIRPTALDVVHHVTVFAMPRTMTSEMAVAIAGRPMSGQRNDGRRPIDRVTHEENPHRMDFLANYVPGSSAMIYPPNFARRLLKGSSLLFQIHYTPNGTATRDQTRFGMLFAEKRPKNEVRVAAIINTNIKIPPGEDNHREWAQITSHEDMYLLSLLPHMHLRGKSCRFEMKTGSEPAKSLLEVPRYDFDWQHVYRPIEPIHVPPGSIIRFRAWYDNSRKNPENPDPTKTVRWGDQTSDEMLLGIIEYYDNSASESE